MFSFTEILYTPIPLHDTNAFQTKSIENGFQICLFELKLTNTPGYFSLTMEIF